MERLQIINELRSYCHPRWFHKILNWKTEALQKLLNHYKGTETKKEDDTYVFVIQKVKGENIKNKMNL